MTHYYKSNSPAILAALVTWKNQKKTFESARKALASTFGGPASIMIRGPLQYVAGVRINRDSELDVHWRKKDRYGYRSLRNAPKIASNTSRDDRRKISDEHLRLKRRWNAHCPSPIDTTLTWQSIGLEPLAMLIYGGECFEHNDTAYFALGMKIDEPDGDYCNGTIEAAIDILPEEYNQARRRNAQQLELSDA